MGTRSGGLDPALISFLARNENVSAEEVVRWRNTDSGMLGISPEAGSMIAPHTSTVHRRDHKALITLSQIESCRRSPNIAFSHRIFA